MKLQLLLPVLYLFYQIHLFFYGHTRFIPANTGYSSLVTLLKSVFLFVNKKYATEFFSPTNFFNLSTYLNLYGHKNTVQPLTTPICVSNPV